MNDSMAGLLSLNIWKSNQIMSQERDLAILSTLNISAISIE